MILIGLRIKINNFWACNISKRFPNVDFKVIDIHPVKQGNSRGILDIKKIKKISQIINFLKTQKDIKKVDVLIDDNDSKLVSFYFTHGTLGDILIKTDVHIRPPLILEKGFIIVNLIGNENGIKDFLNKAREVENVEIKLIKKLNLKSLQKSKLTELQEKIMKSAIELGFYDLPRKITIKKLASRLNLAPSTLAEHLRKAEERIVKDYF
jgi:predicted DNA binding protein